MAANGLQRPESTRAICFRLILLLLLLFIESRLYAQRFELKIFLSSN